MKNTYPLSDDDQRLAKMLKALGNPIRFRIMHILAEKKTCITGEIVELTDLAQSTVSQHLKVLRESGLITGEIDLWLPECCPSSEKGYFVLTTTK